MYEFIFKFIMFSGTGEDKFVIYIPAARLSGEGNKEETL
jgi:hypothetical protein